MTPVFRADWTSLGHGGGTDQTASIAAATRVKELARVFAAGHPTVIHVRLETIFSHGAHALIASPSKHEAKRIPAAHLAGVAMASLTEVGVAGFRPAIA